MHYPAGEFHIAPIFTLRELSLHSSQLESPSSLSPSNQSVPSLSLGMSSYNISHSITHLSFSAANSAGSHDRYVGQESQLEGQTRSVSTSHSMYQYYVTLVPTIYKHSNGRVTNAVQYSVTEHERRTTLGSGKGMPGVYFYYETSPLTVSHVEVVRRWDDVVWGVLTVIGGVVGAGRWIDFGVWKGSWGRGGHTLG